MLRHAGRALSKAHGEGIIHRDLEPENLFITKQEEEILKVAAYVPSIIVRTSGRSASSRMSA